MRLIHIFTTTKQYRDVIETIYCLDGSVSENIILSRDAHPIPPGLSNTRYILAPEGIRGARFWWWAAREAKRLIRSGYSRTDWIVSEQVVGISAFLLRHFLRVRCPALVFFVSPSLKFLIERGWNADRWARPLRLRQQWLHFREMLRRSLVDLTSILGADVIAANSEEILRLFNRFAGKRRMAILPNPISATPGVSSVPREKGLFNLLYVGAMQPAKGIAMGMEIIARLKATIPNARLTMVGGTYPCDAQWFEQLLARYQARCGDSLDYRGKIPFEQLPAVYQTADVFLFPSFYEGSPRVVCEAMQYGCAVVTSDLSGNRVIDPAAEALQFFPAGNLDAALKILEQLAKDRQRLEEVRAASRRVIESRFSAERVAEILLSIYRPMLDKKATEVPELTLAERRSAR